MPKKNKILLAIVIFLVLLLFAGVAFAVTRILNQGSKNENFNLVNTTISWKTPLQDTKDGTVEYGLTDQYGSSKKEDITEPAADHSVVLKDLIPEKTYHYRIVLTDPDKKSKDQTFVTPKCTNSDVCTPPNGNGNGNNNGNSNGNNNGNSNGNGNSNSDAESFRLCCSVDCSSYGVGDDRTYCVNTATPGENGCINIDCGNENFCRSAYGEYAGPYCDGSLPPQ